jgi:hypothetical protein
MKSSVSINRDGRDDDGLSTQHRIGTRAKDDAFVTEDFSWLSIGDDIVGGFSEEIESSGSIPSELAKVRFNNLSSTNGTDEDL